MQECITLSMGETFSNQAPCVPPGAPIVVATICSGPGEGQSIRLRRTASVFGAKHGCKLVLRHPNVNRRHCLIVNTGYRVLLRDLDTNGRTLRNGLKVELEALEDDDRLTLGPWEFKIDVQHSEAPGASDSPVVIDLEPDPTILALEDIESGKMTRLPRDVTLIGRSAGADIVVEDNEVSYAHAAIYCYLGKPAVFDLVSENGTQVNGEHINFAMLQDCDELTFGSKVLRFRSNVPGVKPNGRQGKGSSLKPKPFTPPPEGTLSDLIDLSAESRFK
jgi:pSer/pThr/pTyr-binding forkhead associated (FHA) protein